ncbi:MAG TPA: hypothetical protein VFD46_04365 [Chryseolinea sp.]|nr:hypothetical protein [Chryseolinea sp.]
MKTTKITLLFVLISSLTFAQDYAFKVLANKGANTLKSGADWVPLKTGATLKNGDELKVVENAYLGLVYNSGKPLELKQPGNYKVADLSAKMKGNTATVLNKYTDFILSSNAEDKKNKLNATGAVNRDVIQHSIHVVLPDNQLAGIYDHLAVVNLDTKVAGPYLVTVKNMFDDELNKFEISETSFQIDLNDAKYAKENAVLLEVKSKADPKAVSKTRLIKKLSPAEHATVKKKLAEAGPDITEQTALSKLILARFYEEQNLLIDAITSYEEAIKMAPDVPTFVEEYGYFLTRHSLK